MSLFEEVNKLQNKIRQERKIVREAVKLEKMLMADRASNKKSVYRSVACKFSWDKKNMLFSCKCRNTNQQHRSMFAHKANEIQPPVCTFDRLCKNEKCLRLHSTLESPCDCGKDGDSRYYKIVCSCARRMESKKEFRIRTGFNYTGDPNTKLHGFYLFTPKKPVIDLGIVQSFKIPNSITIRKKEKYNAWKIRQQKKEEQKIV
jgi:hypothetical protein